MPATTTARHNETDALLERVLRGLHGTNPQAAANLEYDLAQCETERKVQQFSVTTKRDGLINFTSDLTDSEVLQSLRSQRSSFAQDLAAKFHKLSPAQYAWSHKLAVDHNAKQQNVAKFDDTQVSQFEALFNAFEAAKAKGAKRLTLRFDGVNVKPNRDLSALWITSQTEKEEGNYGLQPKYLGKVTRIGMDSRLSDDVKEVIMSASKDPLTAAIRYGKVSGECSCCGRELTDPQSIERGIGPICATKFGW
jgi:hypothetical protein